MFPAVGVLSGIAWFCEVFFAMGSSVFSFRGEVVLDFDCLMVLFFVFEIISCGVAFISVSHTEMCTTNFTIL